MFPGLLTISRLLTTAGNLNKTTNKQHYINERTITMANHI